MDNSDRFNLRHCPHLGTMDDPDVHFGFPTPSNLCYQSEPPESANVSHQSDFCLTPQHANCPVYQPGWGGSLPPEFRGILEPDVKKDEFPLGRWLVLLLILIVVFALLLILVNPFDRSDIEQISSLPTTVAPTITTVLVEEVMEPTITSTQIPTFPPTDTLIPSSTPTETPTSTSIPSTPTPGPLVGTPFTTDKTYLIHQIQEGESLPLLVNRYETSEEVIRVVNESRLFYGFLPERMLIIMPGQVESDQVEKLDLIFLEEYIRISDFAPQHGLTEDELRVYNGLNSGDIIPSGRWIIFPEREVFFTATLTPIVTADLSQALTEPFGPNGEYILHLVKPYENISTLEALYQTSVAVIQQANIIEGSIRIDQVLVIMPDRIDPSGISPFRVVQVEDEILVEDLADQLGVPASDLIYYNDLTPSQVISSGQWIIYLVSL